MYEFELELFADKINENGLQWFQNVCIKTVRFHQPGVWTDKICIPSTKKSQYKDYMIEMIKKWRTKVYEYHEFLSLTKTDNNNLKSDHKNFDDLSQLLNKEAIAVGCSIAEGHEIHKNEAGAEIDYNCHYMACVYSSTPKNVIQHSKSNGLCIRNVDYELLCDEYEIEKFTKNNNLYDEHYLSIGQPPIVSTWQDEYPRHLDDEYVKLGDQDHFNYDINESDLFRPISSLHSIAVLKRNWDHYCSIKCEKDINGESCTHIMCNKDDVSSFFWIFEMFFSSPKLIVCSRFKIFL